MMNELPRFIADVHAGKTARLLRMLGFDVIYRNDITTDELAQTAAKEQRVVLSKNIALSKAQQGLWFHHITSDNPFEQLQNIIKEYHLLQSLQPFTRCLVCNGILEAAPKEKVLSVLPENTAKYYDEFWQCHSCHRVYWKGPHYERMMKLVKKIRSV